MKFQALITGSMLLTLIGAAPAQSSHNSPWTGVWRGELDGQPGVILTLADDTGDMGGTVVFNMVSRNEGTPRVIGSDVHVVLNPHITGNILSFHVKHLKDHRELQVAVTLEGDGKANLKCLNCGPDAPVAGLVLTK